MVESAVTADVVAERIRPAFAHRDVTALRPLFAPEARWGNCLGGEEILAWMQQAQAEGLETTLLDIEAHPDRVVVALQLQGTRDDATSPAAPQTYYLIAFVADGQIIELRDAADREEARRAMASAPTPSPLGPRSAITSATPILPVRELTTALEHYRRLGFAVRAYKGGGYGFAERRPVAVDLGVAPDLDPAGNVAAVYLFVEDADALYAEWRAAGVAGELIEPTDTDYGMHEGVHVDPDGNRIRFGSPRHG